jgi:hypothetical protein
MDSQNKFYFFIQILSIILFIPFVFLSMTISLILSTINNFFHPEDLKEEEIKNKDQ